MGEEKNSQNSIRNGNMAEALRERVRLDQIIQETYKRKRTILFSDVCGFTQYMEKMGDICGRAWIQKHHDIVLPLIEANGGSVLDIMGDGVMASFPEALMAARSAIAIQKGLEEHNSQTPSVDMIHVKIGINTGELLEDGNHVAGDVVNVASRIQSHSGSDQILISKKVYNEICNCDDILCRHYGWVHVKGKAEALELYLIVWKNEEVIISSEPKVRASEKKRNEQARTIGHELYIEVMQEKGCLKIGASEQLGGKRSTVRHYEEVPVSMELLREHCRVIPETLNKANRHGRVQRDILIKLREIGQIFNDEIFTPTVKEKIRNTKADHLVINIDDRLVQIPWELIHDGRQFLCQRFNMGRLVRTRQEAIGEGGFRSLARPLKMLVLADPRGDLKWAYTEGTEIRDYIDPKSELVNVTLRTDNVTPEYIRGRLRNFDFVHFAGHYDYNAENPWQSCWRLKSGGLKGLDIGKMAGTGAMPALIFSNACQSGRTDEWALSESIQDEVFGLANAFILAGVKHYVGTFWEVLDEPSRRFALQFYKYLLSGLTIGEALRRARLAVIQEYGEETIVWASYLLYGDPSYNYLAQIEAPEAHEEAPDSSHIPLPKTDLRAREKRDVIDFGIRDHKSKKVLWIVSAMILATAVLVSLFGYPGLLRRKTQEYETALQTAFNQGNYQTALEVGKMLQNDKSDSILAYLIPAEIQFRQGMPAEAQTAFAKVLDAKGSTDLQKARALMGLGRIASLQKQNDKALAYYGRSIEFAPENSDGYLAQAILLDKMGRSEKALELLAKAHELTPQDMLIAAVRNDIHQKITFAREKEKRDRIDRLIKDLLQNSDSPPVAVPWDGWTSRPLTLWIMDLETQGYSMQEGEDRLIVTGIGSRLLQNGRIQLVERAILDKLMEEMKLGVSKLADPGAALSLGKILAARLILSGRIMHANFNTRVSMRLIETETGRIAAAVDETNERDVPVSELADQLSEAILVKLEMLYPLRGKILKSDPGEIKLNIGRLVGVTAGSRFRVVDGKAVVQVVSADTAESTATMVDGNSAPVEGMRVEAF